MNILPSTVRALVARFPAVVPHLKGRARWVVFTEITKTIDPVDGGYYIPKSIAYNPWLRFRDIKTQEYFIRQIERLVTHVYNNQMGGEFIDIMANLISGQLTQAFRQAWADEDGEGDLPAYLSAELERMILSEYDHVDQFFRDIVDARIDETPITPLLVRAGLWAQRYTDAYEQARHLITMANGGNEEWVLGATEAHCPECSALNGIVARASEWDQLGVHPQQPPNPVISCGGWKCDCERRPTEKRRTPKAFDRIIAIVSK
jgi:hypothetical protein